MKASFFHYNKPASLAAGKTTISIHQSGVCHLVENVDCRVPTKGRVRKTAPRFVMVGRGNLRIEGGVGILEGGN